MTNDELLSQVKELGYLKARLLEDGTIIALGDLLFTRAIFMDIDMNGYGKRYCFEDRALADAQFQLLHNGDEEPVGFTARR